jgi:hypothetical protein
MLASMIALDMLAKVLDGEGEVVGICNKNYGDVLSLRDMNSNKSFYNKEAIIACALVLIMQTYKRKY